MKNETSPICYIVAGPNGAGKTTFAMKNLPKKCQRFINVDEIAKGLAPFGISAHDQIRAGKLFFEELEHAIAERQDFAFETTLSGRSHFALVEKLQREGWKIVMFYLFIPSAKFSAERVGMRVKSGGHDVPRADIERRFPRSVANLFKFAEICDVFQCFDNRSGNAKLIFSKIKGEPREIVNESVMAEIEKVAKL